MFCRYCGEEIPDDSLFCLNCGKKLETPVTPLPSVTLATNDAPVEIPQPYEGVPLPQQEPEANEISAPLSAPPAPSGEVNSSLEPHIERFSFQHRVWPPLRYFPVLNSTDVEIEDNNVKITQCKHSKILGRELPSETHTFLKNQVFTTIRCTRMRPLFLGLFLLFTLGCLLLLAYGKALNFRWLLLIAPLAFLIRQSKLEIQLGMTEPIIIYSSDTKALWTLQRALLPSGVPEGVDWAVKDIVSRNFEYYSKEFNKSEHGEDNRFNWAAFLFGPFFCIYRKCGTLARKFFGRYLTLMLGAPLVLAVMFYYINTAERVDLYPLFGIFSVFVICAVQLLGLISYIQCGRQFNRSYYIHCRYLEQQSSESEQAGVSPAKGFFAFLGFYCVTLALTVICLLTVTGQTLDNLLDTGDWNGALNSIGGIVSDPEQSNWLEGEWAVSMSACLDESGIPDTNSGQCTIKITDVEDGMTTASVSSTSKSFNGMMLKVMGDVAYIGTLEDGGMYGYITRDAGSKGFTIDVTTMQSPTGEELELSDYGFYATLAFQSTSFPEVSPAQNTLVDNTALLDAFVGQSWYTSIDGSTDGDDAFSSGFWGMEITFFCFDEVYYATVETPFSTLEKDNDPYLLISFTNDRTYQIEYNQSRFGEYVETQDGQITLRINPVGVMFLTEDDQLNDEMIVTGQLETKADWLNGAYINYDGTASSETIWVTPTMPDSTDLSPLGMELYLRQYCRGLWSSDNRTYDLYSDIQILNGQCGISSNCPFVNFDYLDEMGEFHHAEWFWNNNAVRDSSNPFKFGPNDLMVIDGDLCSRIS